MSPRKLSAAQRISCHFLEADYGEEVAHEGQTPDGPRWLPLPPPSGVATGVAAAGLADSGAAASPSHACGIVYGPAAPPERGATIIPPMKRRLITLSTAGNLKISPLSNQQLHQQRIYPIRRPSDLDGAPVFLGHGGAAAPDTGGGGRNDGWLQHIHAQLPPPPPGTPARQSQPPSSHPFLERRELSPRDDNIVQDGAGGGFHHPYHRRRSSSPEPPPLPPGTPRGSGSRVGGGGGGGGGFVTPRLVLRPVRPFHDRPLAEGCSGASAAVLVEAPAFAAAWPENLTPTHGISQQQKPSLLQQHHHHQQQQQEPQLVGLGAANAISRHYNTCGNATPCGFDSRGAAAVHVDSAAGQHRSLSTPHRDAAAAVGAFTNLAITAADPCTGGGGGSGSHTFAAAAITADGHVADVEYMDGVEATAAAAAATGGLAWASIEVTVAVRPKAGAMRRFAPARIGVDGEGPVDEVHNGYVRGPACGMFDLTRYLTGRDCVRHGGRWISRSQFEKLGGSTMAKWYRSIRVLPDLEPLGEWLERHDMPVLRGPARRSRKRSAAADSGDELGGGHGGGGWDAADDDDGPASAPWVAEAAAQADGASGAAPPEAWANRMLMQHRDGGGGDDLLVQRLLSTWPLSQPFLRPPAAAAAAAAEPAAAVTGAPRCFAGLYGIGPLRQGEHQQEPATDPATPVGAGGAAAALGPGAAVAAVVGAVPGPGREAGGDSAPVADADAAMLAGVPEIKCSLPAVTMALPGFSLSAPRSANLASHSHAAAQDEADAAGPAGGVTHSQPVGAGPAPPRPRLLLQRTGAAAPGDGRGADQPYLFAVAAPPTMLYREGGAASPSGAVGVVAGAQAIEE
uniref:RlsA n=1 Tax=Volvox gigas TaxID=51717 RepID=A0A075M2B9_9CHLO|nr:RlsA [Volvox gigas]